MFSSKKSEVYTFNLRRNNISSSHGVLLFYYYYFLFDFLINDKYIFEIKSINKKYFLKLK